MKVKDMETHEIRRGQKTATFGWVYFTDGNRVRFADGQVFPSNCGACTNRHLETALGYLAENKVKGYKQNGR